MKSHGGADAVAVAAAIDLAARLSNKSWGEEEAEDAQSGDSIAPAAADGTLASRDIA